MDATQYKPTVAWRTKAKSVVQYSAETAGSPATYMLSVKPIDVSELGASPIQVTVGDYLMDFIGTSYRITNVALPKITVSDDFRSGHCPQSGQTAIVYRSVAGGDSPFLAPVYFRFLDKQALANAKRFELDILWKKLYDEKYLLDPEKWKKNLFDAAVKFGVAIGLDHLVSGNEGAAIGIGGKPNSFREFFAGSYGKDVTVYSSVAWDILDLIFVVGNGSTSGSRDNAVEIYKSGLVKIFNALLIGDYNHGSEIPVNGMLRYTAGLGFEGYHGDIWASLGGGTSYFPDTITADTINQESSGKHTHELGSIGLDNVIEGSPVEYGALYNWYAATDVRNITSSDDWVVPTQTQFRTLADYLGAAGDYQNNTIGVKLKETGLIYWNTPNSGATNEYSFNARGNGTRANTGSFFDIKVYGFLMSATANATYYYPAGLKNDSNTFEVFRYSFLNTAIAIRLLYTGAGTPTTYTGNDGKVYPVVLIDTQYWLAANLNETRYRNGDWITGFNGGVYTPILNATWAALTTEAMCYYSDNEAYGGGETPLKNLLHPPIDGMAYGQKDAMWVEVSEADHDHEIGNQVLLFENNLI